MTNTSWLSSFRERKGQESQQFWLVIDFFEKSWFKVEDVHEKKQYFDDDIDLIVWAWDIYHTVEVKFDDYIYRTDNFFFEIVSNEQAATTGCFLKSKADIFLYYDKHNHIWYFFSMSLLQKWFFDVRKRYNSENIKQIDVDFRLKSTHTPWDDWIYQHTTIWRLANKDRVLKSCEKMWIPYFIKNMDEDDITLDDLLKLSLTS